MIAKRFFDIAIVLLSILLLFVPAILVGLLIKLTSKGPAIYWSNRVGFDNQLFDMPKFRSMQVNTPALATHELKRQGSPSQYLTPIGGILRKTSLDEIPQLWSVLVGDMSIVGPRPALYNQDDLVQMRTKAGVHKMKPGITGWAQVNGRDEIPLSQKVELDSYYIKHQSVSLDFYIILLTLLKVLARDNVSH